MCVRGAWGEQRVAVASARARAAALAESTMQSSSHWSEKKKMLFRPLPTADELQEERNLLKQVL